MAGSTMDDAQGLPKFDAVQVFSMALSKRLSAGFEAGSDVEESATLCDPCKTDGESHRAVKYCLDCNQAVCQSCVDCHRKIKQLKDHKLVNGIDPNSVKVSQFVSKCLECPNHPGKTIELLCKQHDDLCCLTCATINHRACTNLTEIASEAEATDIATNVKDLIDHMDEAKMHMKEIVKIHEKHNRTVQSQIDYGFATLLVDLKQNVFSALQAIESHVIQESTGKGNEEIKKGNTEINKWNYDIKQVDEASTVLKSVQANGSNVHIYAAANKIKKAMDSVDRNIASQGNQVERQKLSLKECLQLKQVYMGHPKEVINLSVENVAFKLPEYKRGTTMKGRVSSAQRTKTPSAQRGIYNMVNLSQYCARFRTQAIEYGNVRENVTETATRLYP